MIFTLSKRELKGRYIMYRPSLMLSSREIISLQLGWRKNNHKKAILGRGHVFIAV